MMYRTLSLLVIESQRCTSTLAGTDDRMHCRIWQDVLGIKCRPAWRPGGCQLSGGHIRRRVTEAIHRWISSSLLADLQLLANLRDRLAARESPGLGAIGTPHSHWIRFSGAGHVHPLEYRLDSRFHCVHQ